MHANIVNLNKSILLLIIHFCPLSKRFPSEMLIIIFIFFPLFFCLYLYFLDTNLKGLNREKKLIVPIDFFFKCAYERINWKI